MKALSLKNLGKTYRNGVQALKGINLEVEKGDFFALLGPNGAGKSTAIGIIASLVNKGQGEVEVFGKSLDHDPSGVKKNLGLVPQEFNFGVFEYVEDVIINQAGYFGLSKDRAREQAEKYLKKLDLWEKRRQQVRTLSGGMKRRMMIVRALVHEPKLLILDEPTAGVDIEVRRSMWEFLREINQQGVTIILTTHYLEEAESLCKNIAIIDRGQIIENSSMKSLLGKLHRESYILDYDGPLSSTLLEQFQQKSSFPFSLKVLDDHSLELEVEKSMVLNEVFSLLSQKGIRILSLRNKANRLEELFLNLTGKQEGNHR